MFKHGKQTPAYANEKTASQMIIELQNKNAELRLALGKLVQLCENTNMRHISVNWLNCITEGQEALEKTGYQEGTE